MNQSTPQQPDPQQTSEENIMSQNYKDQILKKNESNVDFIPIHL